MLLWRSTLTKNPFPFLSRGKTTFSVGLYHDKLTSVSKIQLFPLILHTLPNSKRREGPKRNDISFNIIQPRTTVKTHSIPSTWSRSLNQIDRLQCIVYPSVIKGPVQAINLIHACGRDFALLRFTGISTGFRGLKQSNGVFMSIFTVFLIVYRYEVTSKCIVLSQKDCHGGLFHPFSWIIAKTVLPLFPTIIDS